MSEKEEDRKTKVSRICEIIELSRLCEIIEEDDFKDVYFSKEFSGDGNAVGYAIVDKKGYSFLYNYSCGILESTIEEDKEAFKYMKIERRLFK